MRKIEGFTVIHTFSATFFTTFPGKTVGIQNLQTEYKKNCPDFIATESTVKANRNGVTDLFLAR